MKFLLIILFLLFNSCDSGSSGGGSTSCNSCQAGALETHIDNFDGDGACSIDELNELSCSNSISISSSTCDILYFVDDDVAGIQFDVNGTNINGTSLGVDASLLGTDFTLSHNEIGENVYRFLAVSLTGQTIPSGCGILFSIDAESCSGFEFIDVIFSNPSGVEFEVCPN